MNFKSTTQIISTKPKIENCRSIVTEYTSNDIEFLWSKSGLELFYFTKLVSEDLTKKMTWTWYILYIIYSIRTKMQRITL